MLGTPTLDDVDALVFEAAGGDQQQHLALGRQFEDLAAVASPADEVSAKELLVQAGEQYGFAGDQHRALALFRRAVKTGDDTGPDARCFVVQALLAVGATDEADSLAGQIRRSKPTDPLVFACLGAAYETHGQPQEAVRWFTRGVLLTVDEDLGEDPITATTLLCGRLRVRQAMGFPEDDYDLLASALLDRMNAWDDESEEGWDEEDDGWDDVTPAPAPAPAATPVPSRNGPCVCGSGKKYKHCCAQPAPSRS